MNTVIASVSWEIIEPQEGKFDFTNVDSLILKARAKNLKLVFLWFGTWKNATSGYAPGWVKKDTRRFFRAESKEGVKLNNISSLCKEAITADAKAFAALMKHIRKIDEGIYTVLTIQVENETGVRGQERDYCLKANEAFAKQVPSNLMNFLKKNKEYLIPEFDKIWGNSGYKPEGNWTEVFGTDANLVFMGWHTALFVEKVAEAGKAEYTLPMYANAWLEWDYANNKPGDYPSGGPVAKLIPVWQAAAPHIDMLSPDIYRPDFAASCDLFQRMGNPLFIPETHVSAVSAANVFYAIGQGAICFSPFGIDNTNWFPADSPLGKSYQFLSNLMPYLQKYQGTGKMMGLVGVKGEKKEFELGNYRIFIDFQGNEKPELPGYGIIIALSNDEYLVAGSGITVTFPSKLPKRTEILEAYEWIFKDNAWVKDRRLNGDEISLASDSDTQLKFHYNQLSMKTAKVFSYE